MKIKPSDQLTNLGYTNQNYITTHNGKLSFVRIPYPHNHTLFDYPTEKKVMELVKPLDINLPYDFFDEKTGIKIAPYFSDIKTLHQMPLSSVLPQVAQNLKKLHQLPCISKEFNLIKKYHTYKQQTTLPLFDLTPYESLLELYQAFPERVLCHNDLVDGNVIFIHHKNYLIDYEFAADNHPYFDLMSLITENNIQDEHLIQLFLTHYFGYPPTPQQYRDLKQFALIHHLLWCQWAQMQHGYHPDNPIYYEIAKDKYTRLCQESY